MEELKLHKAGYSGKYYKINDIGYYKIGLSPNLFHDKDRKKLIKKEILELKQFLIRNPQLYIDFVIYDNFGNKI